MSPKTKRLWKIPLIALCILGLLIAWLGFGERGLIHLYRTEMKRQDHADRIRQLGEENQALMEEIRRLRTDMQHIESVVRKELNLIKANEIIYRFKKKKTPHDDSGTMSPEAEHGSKKGRSEKEG